MTTWEYTTTVITHGFMGRQSDELNRKEFEQRLTELGAEGWELATVFLDVNLRREKDGHVINRLQAARRLAARRSCYSTS